jgi:hypothetical protein
MNDNPRRLWPWVAVPVLYVLGFGPAVWLAARGSVHPMVVKFVYWPLLCQRVHLTNTLGPALAWYGALGNRARFPDSRDGGRQEQERTEYG